MKSFFGRLKSEIKKSSWVFVVLYFFIIVSIPFTIIVSGISGLGGTIPFLIVIIILDIINRFFKKNKKKQSQPPKTYLGCTLPALLFIIFVLIILFGIGYIAYEGMAKSQMSYDTKKIHARTIKYISAELQRCRHGETSIMDNTLSCSEITTNKIASAVTSISEDLNPYYGWKTGLLAVRISTSNTNDKDVGFINLSPSVSGIIIRTCNKTPCNKEANRQSNTVSIK